jgi:F0F1-type ATP synthase assembly protein I
MAEKQDSNKPEKERDPYSYIGLGFQIISPVLLGVLVGYWLDKHYHTTNSIYTIILSSVMIVVALYIFIRQFLKN